MNTFRKIALSTLALVLMTGEALGAPASYQPAASLSALAGLGAASPGVLHADVLNIGKYDWYSAALPSAYAPQNAACPGAIDGSKYVAATGVATTSCWVAQSVNVGNSGKIIYSSVYGTITAINAACTAGGSTVTLILDSAVTLPGDTALTCGHVMGIGGYFTGAHQITLAASVNAAPTTKIFDTDGGLSVVGVIHNDPWVHWFGAQGNGSANDTARIQAGIDFVKQEGNADSGPAVLQFASAKYRVTSLNLISSLGYYGLRCQYSCAIEGTSVDGTTLLNLNNGSSPTTHISVEGEFRFTTAPGAAYLYGLDAYNLGYSRVKDVTFGGNLTTYAISTQGPNGIVDTFENIHFGADLASSAGGFFVNGNQILIKGGSLNAPAVPGTGAGVTIQDSYNVSVQADVEGWYDAFKLIRAHGVQLSTTYFEANSAHAFVYVYRSSDGISLTGSDFYMPAGSSVFYVEPGMSAVGVNISGLNVRPVGTVSTHRILTVPSGAAFYNSTMTDINANGIPNNVGSGDLRGSTIQDSATSAVHVYANDYHLLTLPTSTSGAVALCKNSDGKTSYALGGFCPGDAQEASAISGSCSSTINFGGSTTNPSGQSLNVARCFWRIDNGELFEDFLIRLNNPGTPGTGDLRVTGVAPITTPNLESGLSYFGSCSTTNVTYPTGSYALVPERDPGGNYITLSGSLPAGGSALTLQYSGLSASNPANSLIGCSLRTRLY